MQACVYAVGYYLLIIVLRSRRSPAAFIMLLQVLGGNVIFYFHFSVYVYVPSPCPKTPKTTTNSNTTQAISYWMMTQNRVESPLVLRSRVVYYHSCSVCGYTVM